MPTPTPTPTPTVSPLPDTVNLKHLPSQLVTRKRMKSHQAVEVTRSNGFKNNAPTHQAATVVVVDIKNRHKIKSKSLERLL